MKAVIYARYSSDSQREESIEGQLRECTEYAERNGITILRSYIDRALSARTADRPEFQNMIKDSEQKLFDVVLIWKLDRFSRDRYDSAHYKRILKKNGVKVVSVKENISDGPEGIILESMLEGYAEYYSAELSEKVVRGMTDNALKCKFNGGMMPIGYVIDAEQHFQIDPLTAPFVLEAFKRYDGGETISSIMNWLNEQGLTNTRGRKMTFNSVGHILHNRRYIGEFRYRDVIVPDGIPAIVPQDLFDRVQEKLAKNKKAPARHKAEDDYLLTTKLFCGYCGAYLCGESGTSRTGKVHHYYKCVSVKKKRTECHKKPVRKEWIEDLVVGETMKMVMDDKAIEAIVSMLMDLQDRDNVNVPLYEQQLREADTAISNLLNAIQQGILTRSTKARLEELENRRDELENRLACEKLAKPKVSAEFMTFWLHRFRKLDVRQQSHRKMLIDTFINAIFLYDDKMVITFNYKEGTKTSTFAELQEAISDKNGSDLDCLAAGKQSDAKCIRLYFIQLYKISSCALLKTASIIRIRLSRTQSISAHKSSNSHACRYRDSSFPNTIASRSRSSGQYLGHSRRMYSTICGTWCAQPAAAKSTPQASAICLPGFRSSTIRSASGESPVRRMISFSGHGLGLRFSGALSQPYTNSGSGRLFSRQSRRMFSFSECETTHSRMPASRQHHRNSFMPG